jgi:hypothetical protein
MKRRSLVLTSESARHPFRQRLRPEILLPLRDRRKDNDEDVKLFVLSFTAFFIATYSFIA